MPADRFAAGRNSIKLCHLGGTALPSAWHGLAITMARVCHQRGTAVPRRWQMLAQYVYERQVYRMKA